MKYLLTLLSLCLLSTFGHTQKTDSATIIEPILLDKAMLSGLNLKPVTSPTQPERRLFQKRLFRGKEIAVYVVSSETAEADWNNYSIDEFIYVLNGRARLHPRNDAERFYYPGDFFFAPKGYTGIWETQGGAEFYHELSVIALDRPKEKVDSLQQPTLLDKAKLAGRGITPKKENKESYHDVLVEGTELDVHLEGEKGSKKEITTPLKEQLIYIIAGTLSLTPKGGVTRTFYTGDFLVLPDGFIGQWESKGHNLFRSLRVYKAN
ncbi:MAG: cupin domain-containing protein [Bacteroidota bacterium]